jgi:hypothetical protein
MADGTMCSAEFLAICCELFRDLVLVAPPRAPCRQTDTPAVPMQIAVAARAKQARTRLRTHIALCRRRACGVGVAKRVDRPWSASAATGRARWLSRCGRPQPETRTIHGAFPDFCLRQVVLRLESKDESRTKRPLPDSRQFSCRRWQSVGPERYGDPVTGPNPRHVGGAAVSPPDAAVWAPPGHTQAVPPTPAPAAPGPYAQQQPPAGAPQRRGWAGWIVIGASALLAIAAVTMGVIDLAKPAPAPTTTTVTAAPPTYPPDQVAAAKKESCDASLNAANTLAAASQQVANAAANRNSPEWQAALANFQNVVMVETTYLELHTPAATPPNVANPTRDFISAYRDSADALTRGVDDNAAAQRTHATADALNKACG